MRKEPKMSKLTHFTVEIYKADKRIKKDARYGKDKKGLRFVDVIDFAPSTRDYISTVVKRYQDDGYFAQVFETYVMKKNMMNGQEYAERYDTPYFCSPSSETYWSM
jgi:aspartyl aminopeptidase